MRSTTTDPRPVRPAVVAVAVGALLAVGACAPTPWTDRAVEATFGQELDAE